MRCPMLCQEEEAGADTPDWVKAMRAGWQSELANIRPEQQAKLLARQKQRR